MQIASISIYSHEGERRDVEFTPGALNIVTGDSKTGKSALLSIVDYCLGRKKSSIPQTAPFRKISWYAVLLQFADGSRAIAARRAPSPGKLSTRAMLEFGGPGLGPADRDLLRLNTDTDSLRAQLGTRIDLADVRVESSEYSSRGPVTIGLGNAVPFTLQEQHEIDSKTILFHRQNEPGIAFGLKDGLPFFLGAVDGQQASKRAQLRDARTRLRRLDASIGSAEEERHTWTQQLEELLAEARSVQLVAAPAEGEDALTLLNRLRFDRSRKPLAVDVDVRTQDERRALELNRVAVSNELQVLLSHRDLLLDERDSEGGYDKSLVAQSGRLTVLNLLPSEHSAADSCPLCAQPLADPDPTIGQMNRRLDQLRTELQEVSAQRPGTQKAVSKVAERIKTVRQQLNVIDAALITHASAGVSESLEAAQEFVRGRVDAIVSRLQSFDDEGLAQLRRERETAVAAVEALEKELNGGAAREQLHSRLNALSHMLGRYVSELRLEQAGDPIRLDVDKLTIVADTASGPLPLENIGSGENWVGYHVATHLALHEFFIQQQRPVPRFLMIDQPSKAHFQSDLPLAGEDPDRETVRNMFQLFARFAEEQKGKFQLIVIDHANYDDEWFQKSVRHNWRGGAVLIPESWPLPGEALHLTDLDAET